MNTYIDMCVCVSVCVCVCKKKLSWKMKTKLLILINNAYNTFHLVSFNRFAEAELAEYVIRINC